MVEKNDKKKYIIMNILLMIIQMKYLNIYSCNLSKYSLQKLAKKNHEHYGNFSIAMSKAGSFKSHNVLD